MKYLTLDHLDQFLRRGKWMEQWIGPVIRDDRIFLRWLSMVREATRDGGDRYIIFVDDVYTDDEVVNLEAPCLYDYDQPEGERSEFSSREEALEFVVNGLKGSKVRFVGFGFGYMQVAYEQYLKSKFPS